MRVDQVGFFEINIRHYQTIVNKYYTQGYSQKGIEDALKKLSLNIRSTDKENNITFSPHICVRLSHLKKGYIVFFHCPQCNWHYRKLYFLNNKLKCRICHGLTYRKQQWHDTIVRRLAWDQTYRDMYMNGNSPSEIMYLSLEGNVRAMRLVEANSIRDRLVERGYKKADEIIKFYERYYKYHKNELSQE